MRSTRATEPEAMSPAEDFIRPHKAAKTADGTLLVSKYITTRRVDRVTLAG